MKELEKLSSTYYEVQRFSKQHWNDFYEILTVDVYRWAWYVVNTRSVFYVSASSDYLRDAEPDTIALAPFLDLLNHSPHANVSLLETLLFCSDFHTVHKLSDFLNKYSQGSCCSVLEK